jgi:polyisoprenoid-binding protein YceI
MLKDFLDSCLAEKTSRISKHSHILCTFLVLMAVSLSSHANMSSQDTFNFNAKNSEVAFSGEHAGMPFKGVFKQWSAEITLPPAPLPQISANFVISSAKTGNSTYDSTLPSGDWFDVKNYPKSQFESTEITLVGSDYEVSGLLTLRGISQAVTFLLKDEGNRFSASFKIDRLAHNIGMESDPSAEWVSQNIKMTLTLKK